MYSIGSTEYKICCNMGKDNGNVTCGKLSIDSNRQLSKRCRMAFWKCCKDLYGIQGNKLFHHCMYLIRRQRKHKQSDFFLHLWLCFWLARLHVDVLAYGYTCNSSSPCFDTPSGYSIGIINDQIFFQNSTMALYAPTETRKYQTIFPQV